VQAKASLTSGVRIGLAFALVSLLHAVGASASEATEKTRIIEAMESMYVAAANDDLAMFSRFTTPDFFSFEGGVRMSGDELMQLIKGAHAAGKVYVWRVTEPRVEVYGQAALITYINRGSIQDADGTKKDVSWLESALLKKEREAWRIHFFHSTRVPVKN
jgi:ketosteroid isomerase-like protein